MQNDPHCCFKAAKLFIPNDSVQSITYINQPCTPSCAHLRSLQLFRPATMIFQTYLLSSLLFTPQILASQAPLAAPTDSVLEIRLATYNIRYDSQPDNITVAESLAALPQHTSPPSQFYTNTTERPWSTRRLYVANDILFNRATIFSGQELLSRQINDLSILLGPLWSWIGRARDDGLSAGEFSPIFYRNDLFRLLASDTFWLSASPFEPSKFLDAGSRRICTVARFASLTRPSRRFTILNTHLDDQSAGQRELGASLILHRAHYEAITTRAPVLMTGDLNSPPNDTAYKIMTGTHLASTDLNHTFLAKYAWTPDQNKGFEDFTLLDLLDFLEPRAKIGTNYATFTDFAAVDKTDTTQFQRLDYILAGNTPGFSVQSYRVTDNLADDGVYHSDHRPVFADITMY